MKIKINFIPHKDHLFTTLGHWAYDEWELNIWVSDEICWQNKVLVIAHELIEVAVCINEGITTEECDKFDALFESEYDAGIWTKDIEAGYDKRCPYRKGHIWGGRFERLVCWILGGDWKKLNAECNELMLTGKLNKERI
jgi:hypothetical protein